MELTDARCRIVNEYIRRVIGEASRNNLQAFETFRHLLLN